MYIDYDSIDHRHHVYIHSVVNTKLSFHLLSQDTRDRECWKVEAPYVSYMSPSRHRVLSELSVCVGIRNPFVSFT